MEELEKVYAVKFITYTNSMDDTVHCPDPKGGLGHYLSVPANSSFLVRESQLEEYKKFGNGYKSVVLAGYLPKED